ncbi:MAG: hypothetical protein ABJB09_07120 [Verrucomicrobiota bacterium]
MKLILATIAFALAMSAAAVCGQEPPLPDKNGTPEPNPPAVVSPTPLPVEPPQIVPDPPAAKVAPILPDLEASFRQSPLTQASEEYRLHLEWRQLQNRTAHDPAVEAARQAAARAKTDQEKRARLGDYYKIQCARMQALTTAPDVKAYLEAKKAAELAGLVQPRVHPAQTAKRRVVP